MERLKPLHNFDLPHLKWGSQKLLRCMKVDSVSNIDRNQSSDSGGGSGGGGEGGGGGSMIGTLRRDLEFDRRFRSSGYDYKFCSSEKVKERNGVAIGVVAGDGEIEKTREKLMVDFQNEVVKMKDAILRERMVNNSPDPAATTSYNSPAERPWNLRTRRAACKAPRSPTNGGEVLKPNSSSPATNDCINPKLRPTNGVVVAPTEKRERPKFSVSLSRREVDEDFMAIAGRRLPRKPKKRPRVVQKQLDTLFPGLWLSEITADMYKVADEDTGKR
ncbi:hypothetical protein QVD17_31921 [Tagetes erecta]|uniref:Uncharacterized protein n=1 Tax=Tagetes erecta TaxID=13708 RepID=A0AAD8NPS2_TARER|nr:hypothetical protein QVD17_31921 [Tagetes erecta]